MIPSNDTGSTYVAIMKSYNIPEGKVKEKAHIFGAKDMSIEKKDVASGDVDKSYNLYDTKVKEKAQLIEKRKVFEKIPSFVMPSSLAKGSIFKPSATIGSLKVASARENSLQPSINNNDAATYQGTHQLASKVTSIDKDTVRRDIHIRTEFEDPSSEEGVGLNTNRSLSSESSRWTRVDQPIDASMTCSTALSDRDRSNRFYLQALSERRKLFYVGMKIDVLLKEDKEKLHRVSAQRHVPTEKWYAATIGAVGRFYLTVTYLTIDKVDKLHIVDDARRIRVYLDNFDDYLASHQAKERTHSNPIAHFPSKKSSISNSSSANSIASGSNGHAIKKNTVNDLNQILDELVLSDSYSSSSDSQGSFSLRQRSNRSRFNSSPTSEALTSRRSLRSPVNVPSEIDDDPASHTHDDDDVDDERLQRLLTKTWLNHSTNERENIRKALLESSSESSVDDGIHESRSTIELQDTKVSLSPSYGIAVICDESMQHMTDLDSIFQSVLSDPDNYDHSIVKSISPISVETNQTSVYQKTKFQRGKKMSPRSLRANDAHTAAPSTSRAMKGDREHSVVKPSAQSDVPDAPKSPRSPGQLKNHEKVVRRTMSDVVQSIPTTMDQFMHKSGSILKTSKVAQGTGTGKLKDKLMKRTVSDGVQNVAVDAALITKSSPISRKAKHDKDSEKLVRRSTPMTIPHAASFDASDAGSLGIASIASGNSKLSEAQSPDKKLKGKVSVGNNTKYLSTDRPDVGSTGKLPRSPRASDTKLLMKSAPDSTKSLTRQANTTQRTATKPIEKIMKKTVSEGMMSTGSNSSTGVATSSIATSYPSGAEVKSMKRTSSEGVKSERTSISGGIKTNTTKADDDGSVSTKKSVVKAVKSLSVSDSSSTRITKEYDSISKVSTRASLSETTEGNSKGTVSEGGNSALTLNLLLTIDIPEPSNSVEFVEVDVSKKSSSGKVLRRARSDLIRADISDTATISDFRATQAVAKAVKSQRVIVENYSADDMDLPGVASFDEFDNLTTMKVITSPNKGLKRIKSESMMGLYFTDDVGFESSPKVVQAVRKVPNSEIKTEDTSDDVSVGKVSAAVIDNGSIRKNPHVTSVISANRPTEAKAIRRTSSEVMTLNKESTMDFTGNASIASSNKSANQTKMYRRTSSEVMTRYKDGIDTGVKSKAPPSNWSSENKMTSIQQSSRKVVTGVSRNMKVSTGGAVSIGSISSRMVRTTSTIAAKPSQQDASGTVGNVFSNSNPPMPPTIELDLPNETSLVEPSLKVDDIEEVIPTEAAKQDSSSAVTHLSAIPTENTIDIAVEGSEMKSDITKTIQSESIHAADISTATKSNRTSKSKSEISKIPSDEKSRRSGSHSRDGIDIGFIGAVINVSQKNRKSSSDGVKVTPNPVESVIATVSAEDVVPNPVESVMATVAAEDVFPNSVESVMPTVAAEDVVAVSDHERFTTPDKITESSHHLLHSIVDESLTMMSPEKSLQVILDRVVHHGFKPISMDPADCDPDQLPESFFSSDISVLVPIVIGGRTPQKLLTSILNNSSYISPIVAASPSSAFSTSRYTRRARVLNVSMSEPFIQISPPKSIASTSSGRRKCYHPKHNRDLLDPTYIFVWCGRHCICSNCIRMYTINESHSPLLTCYRCKNQIPQPTNRSKPLFNIPRASNDCAVVTANAILKKFRDASARQYITHEDMRAVVNIINHRPYVEGMEYDMMEVLTALEIRDFYQTNCIIWHLDGKTKEVVIPEQALLIFLKSPQHFYTYIKLEPDRWRLFDSTHITVKISVTLEELKILVEPFIESNSQTNTAAVAIINKQRCAINMKSCDEIACRARVCGKHLVCSRCDSDDTRRAYRTKNKLFYCNICTNPNTDNSSILSDDNTIDDTLYSLITMDN